MKRYGTCIVCLCCIILTLAAPLTAGAAAPDYELSILYAQTFSAESAAYDASAASATSAQPGEIVVLTLGFRNNAASAVEIGAFSAQIAYDTDRLEPYPLFRDAACQLGDAFSQWTSVSNALVGNNYVNAGAMSLNVFTAAANSQTELARFAFRVKSGAADGVARFTFDNTNKSKNNVTNSKAKKLKLGAFAPFTLTVGANSAAYEYALDRLTIAGREISAEIMNQSGAGGTLIIAAYADSGKFLRCAMETIAESRIAQGSAGSVTVQLDTSGAKTVRAFLLNADASKAISEPRSITIS